MYILVLYIEKLVILQLFKLTILSSFLRSLYSSASLYRIISLVIGMLHYLCG